MFLESNPKQLLCSFHSILKMGVIIITQKKGSEVEKRYDLSDLQQVYEVCAIQDEQTKIA